MRKRIIAIIAASLAIIILGISLAAVYEYVETIVFVDPADNETRYYAKNKNGEYKLYAKGSKTPLETTNFNNKTYYVTALGTLVSVDASTGVADEYIPIDTEGNENIGTNNRVLIFPHIEKKNMLSLEVHNEHGSFTFQRVNEALELDPAGDFIIKGSPFTSYDQELFAELYVGAGYSLTLLKIQNPIRRTVDGALCPHSYTGEDDKVYYADGCDCVYSEYGLIPEETRVKYVIDEKTGKVALDENKNPITEEYSYEPAYYILTDISGNRYKLIVGDKLVTGGGYYAQYVDIDKDGNETPRRAVYVIDTSSGGCLTSPIEDYVTPQLCYPLPMARYYDVDNFIIGNRKIDKEQYKGQEIEDIYKKIISFSYIDLEERENTMASTVPYKFDLDLEGFSASDTAINSCLYNFYSPTLTRTVKFGISEADLVEYGFWIETKDSEGNVVKNEKGEIQYDIFAKYFVSYTFEVIDNSGNITQIIDQTVLISDIDYEETGKYYVFTHETVKDKDGKTVADYPYDFIAEAEGEMFNFLLWDEYDWVDPSYVNQNIAYVQSIKLSADNYEAIFELDNKSTDQSGGVSSTLLKVSALQNGTDRVETFNYVDVTDVNGYYWVVSPSGIKVYNSKTGKEAEIDKKYSYYDYNALDIQVLCRTGYIKAADKWIEVTANYVNIYAVGTKDEKTGTETPGVLIESICRYDTDLWRKFYQTLLYANLEGSYTLDTEEEEKAIVDDPANLLLTIEIKMKDAESAGGTEYHNVYKFYKIPGSARKAYIMISTDGGQTFNGGFYVYKNKVEKFVSDSQKFFANEIIDPQAKK